MGWRPSHLKRAAIHSRAMAFSGVSVSRPRRALPERNSRSARIFGIVMTSLAGARLELGAWDSSKVGSSIPTRRNMQRIVTPLDVARTCCGRGDGESSAPGIATCTLAKTRRHRLTQTGASRRTPIDTVGSSSIESSSHLSLTQEGTTSGTYELTEAVSPQSRLVARGVLPSRGASCANRRPPRASGRPASIRVSLFVELAGLRGNLGVTRHLYHYLYTTTTLLDRIERICHSIQNL